MHTLSTHVGHLVSVGLGFFGLFFFCDARSPSQNISGPGQCLNAGVRLVKGGIWLQMLHVDNDIACLPLVFDPEQQKWKQFIESWYELGPKR